MVQSFHVATGMGLRYQRQTARIRTRATRQHQKDGECVCDSLATEYVGIFREKKTKTDQKKGPNETPQLLF